MPSHTVVQGEHLSRISRQYGFRDINTIWDDPQNAALKKRRVNPHVLLPGDVLFIPEKKQKTETRPTTNVHTFHVPSPMLKLKLVVRDFDGQPIPNTPCDLTVEGKSYPATTDSGGKIEISIPADAESGTLKISSLDLELPVRIGHLDPVEAGTGWRHRLINLGYYTASQDDDKTELRQAIEEFQCDQKLKVTGELDDGTLAKLKDGHGC